MLRAICGILVATALILKSNGLAAQDPAPRFELASIRPTAPRTAEQVASRDFTGFGFNIFESRLSARNVSLIDLIYRAFRVEPFQIVAPEWLQRNDRERFDIQATYAEGSTREQLPEMIRRLLAERFGLITHVESRRMDVYELVVGDAGIKMIEVAEPDERANVRKPLQGERVDALAEEALSSSFNGTTSSVRVRTDQEVFQMVQNSELGTAELVATRMSLATLASRLRAFAERPVLDRTQLKGLYQFRLVLPRDPLLRGGGPTTDVNGNPIRRNPSGISVLKAVETLGLRLEPRRAPMNMVIIDKVERTPSEN